VYDNDIEVFDRAGAKKHSEYTIGKESNSKNNSAHSPKEGKRKLRSYIF
jgi:hypothetical protein